MNDRIIKVSYPVKYGCVRVYLSKTPNSINRIYEMVNYFEKNIFSDKIKFKTEKTSDNNLLKAVINLHNRDGIKDIQQIRKMIQQIDAGKDILHPSELPNIKLVKTKNNEFVLFDGHHSLLAYMFVGRKYLYDVPHLIIMNPKGYVTDNELLVFFGPVAHKLKGLDWRDYCINWQAPKERQLCKRIQRNMGELLKSILAYL